MRCYKPRDIENLNCSIISFREVVHISQKDTNLNPTFKNSKRVGYTCRNGLFMVRKNIEGKTRVVYSSRNEQDIINYLKDIKITCLKINNS